LPKRQNEAATTAFTYQKNIDLLMAFCRFRSGLDALHIAGWPCPSTLL